MDWLEPDQGIRRKQRCWTPNRELMISNQIGYFANANNSDPLFPAVKLLLACDGANGSTTFVDSSRQNSTITTNGNAQVSTTSPQFGTGCLLLDGAGDYLRVPSSAFSLGLSDFTVEFALNVTPTSSASYARFFQLGTNATTGGLWIVRNSTSNPIQFLVQICGTGGYVTLFTTTATAPNGSWSHFALTRASGTWRCFVNGVLDSSSTYFDNAASSIVSNPAYLGSNSTGGESLAGRLDNIRVTQGYARYTASFTPPSSAFPTL